MSLKTNKKSIIFGAFLALGFLLLGNLKSTLAVDGLMNGKMITGYSEDYIMWLQTYDQSTAPFFSDKFYIGKNGNVGIGKSNPGYALDVNGAINGTSVLVNGVAVGSGGSQWVSGSGGAIYYTGGNVGVGVTAPTVKLDNTGSFKTSLFATISSLGSGLGTDSVVMVDTNGGLFSTSTSNFAGGTNFWGGARNSNIWNGDTGAGNVGIGTTNPSQILQVGAYAEGANRYIHIGKGTLHEGGITFGYSDTADWKIAEDSAEGFGITGIKSDEDFVINVNDGGVQKDIFKIDSSEAYALFPNGNVGIGTTNPSQKLDVVGAINSQVTNAMAQFTAYSPSVNYPRAQFLVGNTASDANVALVVAPLFSSVGAGKTSFISIDTNKDTLDDSNYNAVIAVSASDGTTFLSTAKRGGNSPGGGDIYFGPANTERMRITSAGNVGVGTTAPGVKLDINGYLRATGATISAIGAGIIMADSSGNLYSTSTTVATGLPSPSGISGQTLRSDGANWVANSLLFNNGTNVGIGTTTPASKLQVYGTTGRLAIFGEVGASTAIVNPVNVSFGSTYGNSVPGSVNNLKWDLFTSASSGSRYGIGMSSNLMEFQSGPNGGLGFFVNQGTEAMRIISTGYVGIGTTSPGSKLHVQATAVASTRESLFKGAVSDAGNDAFYIGNATITDNRFAPIFAGYMDSTSVSNIMAFKAMTSAAQDTGTTPMMNFLVSRSNSATDPLNAGFADITTRPLFTFSNNATVAMSILANSNIGIAKTNPGATLDVVGNGNFSSTVNGTSLCIAGDCRTSWPLASGWVVNGNEVYKANTSGNVGIGTTNPGAQLHQQISSVGSVVYHRIQNTDTTNTSSGAGIFLQPTSSATWGSKIWTDRGGSAGAALGLNFGVSNNADPITTPIMSITYGGNVGVGITNPSYKLDVQGGQINTSGGLCIAGDCKTAWSQVTGSGTSYWNLSGSNLYASSTSYNVGVGTTNPLAPLHVESSGGVSKGIYLKSTSANSYASIDFQNDSGLNGQFLSTGSTFTNGGFGSNELILGAELTTSKLHLAAIGASGEIKFTTGGLAAINERMRINSSGNVGIGTTNPAQKLEVAGTIRSNSANTGTIQLGQAHHIIQNNYDASTNKMRIQNWDGVDYFDSLILDGNNHTISLASAEGNVGIAKTNPGATLDVVGNGNFSSTVNGTSICIAGDCRTSWPLASGWVVNGNEVYKANTSGNVGIGTTNPANTLDIRGGGYPFAAQGTNGKGFVLGDNASYADVIGLNNTHGAYNDINFRTSATAGQLYLKTDGNVGIGTTTPSAKLQVQGTSYLNGQITTSLSGSGNRCIYVDASGNLLAKTTDCGTATGGDNLGDHTATQNIKLGNYWLSGDGGNEGVFVKSDGNVGIGTSSPKNLLHVYNPSSISVPMVMLEGYNHVLGLKGATPYAEYFNTSGARLGWFGYGLNTTDLYFSNDNATGPIYFSTNGYANKRMTIDASGNVGVGLINPAVKLDISGYFRATGATISAIGAGIIMADSSGNLYSTSTAMATGIPSPSGISGQTLRSNGTNWIANDVLFNNGTNVGVGTTNPAQKLDVQGNLAIGSNVLGGGSIYGYSGGASYATLKMYDSANGYTLLNNQGYGIKLQTAGNDRMTILNGGNVGIGTTNPGTLLDVNGYFRTTGATVSALGAGIVMSNSSGVLYSTSTTMAIGGPYLPLAGDTMTGPINMGDNDITNVGNMTINHKLTVYTIDPLYKIKGINYSTYAASISGGVKEEYVGKIKISEPTASGQEYEAAIDFSEVKEGSDLWVWREVVEFNKDAVDIAITPYGRFAQVYYLIENNKLIFRSDRPVEISYRLIAKRFDWRDWPTRATDQSISGVEVRR